jgi:hypothetical protein
MNFLASSAPKPKTDPASTKDIDRGLYGCRSLPIVFNGSDSYDIALYASVPRALEVIPMAGATCQWIDRHMGRW